MFKIKERYQDIIVLLLITFLIYSNLNLIEYGLPYFENRDENSFKISSLAYLYKITGNKFYLAGDPFVAPLINLLIILKIIFVNDFLLNSLSFSEIKSKIYFNPEIFLLYGRISSLIITSFSLWFFYLIFKKLKINFFIIISIFVSLTFSPFIFDISLVNGKNSFYLFLFILQIYFFIKYYLKINKFNFNSYLIFAILSVLSFGVNYWGAFPSLYSILILHFKKYKFVKINYLIIFFIIFFSGIVTNFLLSPESMFSHIIDLDNIHGFENHQNENLSLFFKVFFLKLLAIFKILNNTEYIFFPFIILLTFYLINNFKNKNLCLFLIILIIMPIMLVLISANAEPHIRYFSGVICAMLLVFSLMVNDILNKENFLKTLTIFLILNLTITYLKFYSMSEIRTNIKKNHSFYEFFLSNEQINTDTLYIIPALEKRKNLKNLEFYRDLHKNKIIKNKKFKKDNLDNIYKKIDNYENKNLNISYPKFKKNLHIFSENLFEIEKPADFFDLAKKHFKYIVIQQNYITKNTNNELTPGLTEYVKNNLILIKNLFTLKQIEEEEIEFNFTLRKLFILKHNYSRNEKKKNESSKLVFGNNYSLYKFN